MIIERFEKLIYKWSDDRGLPENSTEKTRFDKLFEEVEELKEAIFVDNLRDEIKLEAGDILVTLINIIRYYDLTLIECLSAAYEKIKDREGRMINGTFVKKSDIQE